MPRYAPPPGAARLSCIRVVPGVAQTMAGRSCSLLLVHDPIGRSADPEVVARDMVGIAHGLGLTPQWQSSPGRARRVVLAEGHVLLDYGHDRHLLQGTVERWWYDLAVASGYIRLTVGADPLPDERMGDALAYLAASKERGTLWSGIAGTRLPIPQARR